MCGIFGVIRKETFSLKEKVKLQKSFLKLKHRGPDEQATLVLDKGKVFFGFARLSIQGVLSGSQPFFYKDLVVLCNGEIYNHKELEIMVQTIHDESSRSDCEVIGPLFDYLKRDISKLCRELSGEFSFVIYERSTQKLYYGTDELSIRPLFLAFNEEGFSFSSELRPLSVRKNKKIIRVNGGECGVIMLPFIGKPSDKDRSKVYTARKDYSITHHKCQYYTFPKTKLIGTSYVFRNLGKKTYKMTYDIAKKQLRRCLIKNLRLKLNPDVEYAFLLSGGLDSSLVCGIATKILREKDPNAKIKTFTVGFDKNAPDILAARKVAKYLNSDHTEVIVSIKDGIDAIYNVVKSTGSYDQTTIRASIPQFLLTKYIRKNHPKIKVLFVGDVADELFGSYLYFRNAPSSKAAREECKRLLKDICRFDGLRMDRICSAFGFEARFMFFNHDLLDLVLSFPEEYTDCRTNGPNKGIEKKILRDAFEGENIIPNCVLHRVKHATSDATSSKSGWKDAIKKHANKQISDKDLKVISKRFTHNPPQTKEDWLYRDKFRRIFSGLKPTDRRNINEIYPSEKTIPYKWLPRWSGDVTDSSATVLRIFNESKF